MENSGTARTKSPPAGLPVSEPCRAVQDGEVPLVGLCKGDPAVIQVGLRAAGAQHGKACHECRVLCFVASIST